MYQIPVIVYVVLSVCVLGGNQCSCLLPVPDLLPYITYFTHTTLCQTFIFASDGLSNTQLRSSLFSSVGLSNVVLQSADLLPVSMSLFSRSIKRPFISRSITSLFIHSIKHPSSVYNVLLYSGLPNFHPQSVYQASSV